MHRWQTTVAAAAIFAGLGGYTAAGSAHAATRAAHHSFSTHVTVTTRTVTSLRPGGIVYVPVPVDNTGGLPLKVLGVVGLPVATSDRDCPVTDVATWPYLGPLPVVVPAQAPRIVGTVPFSLPPTAPPRCRDATVTVRITTTAVQAG